ncbi:MAG TPA: O-methyltransferase [Candidatus Baltobacteraceae bacterium]|nr:O-methyltransferase [Candidatus Baltobacteraceae bacterium]
MEDLMRYLDGLHPEQHPLLLELQQHGRKDGVPIVSRETGRFLSVMVHMMQANRILEIGTGYGYSTLWMALAQPQLGRIWTIDPDSERTSVALSYFQRAGEDDYITIFNQDTLELMNSFQVRNLDIVFIDADREHYREYLELAIPMLKLSGIVVIDDCLVGGLDEFNAYFLSHPALDATILPIGNGTGIGARIK